MLAKYPLPEDWRKVRFSDEVHFGYGPEAVPRVLRRPWEKDCPDCVTERREPSVKQMKKVHAWGAIGYDFKSELIFYDNPSNGNGKMSQDLYLTIILKAVVLPWIEAGENFVLEEDGDSGHGPGKDNPVGAWKNMVGLKHYFNCALSPDLSPIENGWLPVKLRVREVSHWDAEFTKELALEGWEGIKQETINKWVDSIPDRLRRVIYDHGKLVVA